MSEISGGRAHLILSTSNLKQLVLRASGPDSDREEVERDVLKCARLDIHTSHSELEIDAAHCRQVRQEGRRHPERAVMFLSPFSSWAPVRVVCVWFTCGLAEMLDQTNDGIGA